MFCNVRFCDEPKVHVTVRDASGLVITIGASDRATGIAARSSVTMRAPRNSGTARVDAFGLGLCVSMGIPIGPPCSRPRPFTFIRGGGRPFGERNYPGVRT